MKIEYESPHARLKLLSEISQPYSSTLLEDYYFIGCQHILPSTHLMLRSCFDMGLKPERTALIGKCYSTSRVTQKLMQKEGIYVCSSSSEFDSHKAYDDQFQLNIKSFYKDIFNLLKIPFGAKIIVMDDGGELISLVNEACDYFGKVVCVEQTSAGYHKLDKINLNTSVINIARCATKLSVETPAVCKYQIDLMYKFIKGLNLSIKKVLIIGNGTLGNCLVKILRPHHEVVCYDIKKSLSEINKNELDFSIFDVIIGATGDKVFSNINGLKLKKNTLLASVSSSDREFDAANLRRRIEKVINCHTNLTIGGIHLLNCGFPLNFQGAEEDTIPLEKIQLTIGLLFLAIYQGIAINDRHVGLIDLEEDYSKELEDRISSSTFTSLLTSNLQTLPTTRLYNFLNTIKIVL